MRYHLPLRTKQREDQRNDHLPYPVPPLVLRRRHHPSWYRAHGGAVLATTIDKYCYLTCRYLPPFFEHRIRLVYRRIETCMSVDEISHPSVRESLRLLKIERGVELHHDGDLPARSGMGSSSASRSAYCTPCTPCKARW
ncbi:MAG: hypothetical protein U0797_11640 [Gemmataceae bacterium]